MLWFNKAGYLVKVVGLINEVKEQESGKRRLYSEQFRKKAVLLVAEQGYTIVQAAQVVDTGGKNLQRWVRKLPCQAASAGEEYWMSGC